MLEYCEPVGMLDVAAAGIRMNGCGEGMVVVMEVCEELYGTPKAMREVELAELVQHALLHPFTDAPHERGTEVLGTEPGRLYLFQAWRFLHWTTGDPWAARASVFFRDVRETNTAGALRHRGVPFFAFADGSPPAGVGE